MCFHFTNLKSVLKVEVSSSFKGNVNIFPCFCVEVTDGSNNLLSESAAVVKQAAM